MKTFLAVIGCIVVVMIMLVLGLGGFAVYKGTQLADAAEQAFVAVSATDERYPVDIPANGLLEDDQLRRFFAARDVALAPIQKVLGRLEGLEEQAPDGILDGLSIAFGLVGEVSRIFKEVPLQLEVGLTSQQMPISEFVWVAETIHGTLIAAADEGNEDAQAFIREFERGQQDMNVNVKANEVRLDYGEMRDHLKRRIDGWEPVNLEKVLDARDELEGNVAGLLVDAMTLDWHFRDERGPEADGEEPSER